MVKYCEKNNIRYIIDVQDLWPEAFKLCFHVPVISNILFAPVNAYINGAYKRARMKYVPYQKHMPIEQSELIISVRELMLYF